jgi:hypothetical protein
LRGTFATIHSSDTRRSSIAAVRQFAFFSFTVADLPHSLIRHGAIATATFCRSDGEASALYSRAIVSAAATATGATRETLSSAAFRPQ